MNLQHRRFIKTVVPDDGFDTVDVAPRLCPQLRTTQGARRDEQRTCFLSRENIVKMVKTTVAVHCFCQYGQLS